MTNRLLRRDALALIGHKYTFNLIDSCRCYILVPKSLCQYVRYVDIHNVTMCKSHPEAGFVSWPPDLAEYTRPFRYLIHVNLFPEWARSPCNDYYPEAADDESLRDDRDGTKSDVSLCGWHGGREYQDGLPSISHDSSVYDAFAAVKVHAKSCRVMVEQFDEETKNTVVQLVELEDHDVKSYEKSLEDDL
ncbi:hypothetical protein K402DRAFT_453619 [Aulographum hederae CBS 113979]|uniref:Uncharacterized protein n=1 Tax=Aulographum hederae CBS 113979 TaxID=1176131 RepID=A0A6G1H3B1_9PEZI|nr:hypothetical protein K402DRAFT_453619 [Aulographum hederae CBS 113979]